MKKRRSPAPTAPRDSGATPELLARIETVRREIPGSLTETWHQPAHHRLRKSGAITPEAEAEVRSLIDKWLLYAHGARDIGQGGGDEGASIVTKQMLAGDTVRGFEARFGKAAMQIIVESCVDCVRPAKVAQNHLRFRAPHNPGRPSTRWLEDGRAVLDGYLIPLFRAMAKKGSLHGANDVAKGPRSPVLGLAPTASATSLLPVSA